jgi:hypothetical protein
MWLLDLRALFVFLKLIKKPLRPLPALAPHEAHGICQYTGGGNMATLATMNVGNVNGMVPVSLVLRVSSAKTHTQVNSGNLGHAKERFRCRHAHVTLPALVLVARYARAIAGRIVGRTLAAAASAPFAPGAVGRVSLRAIIAVARAEVADVRVILQAMVPLTNGAVGNEAG